jgi:anti-sigma regulatory factor (Ser/Thr protein kinase)
VKLHNGLPDSRCERPSTWESGVTEGLATIHLRSDPEEIPRARHLARDQLWAWGVVDELPILELALSELVTKAVSHGSGPVEVRMSLDCGRLRVDVTDDGTTAQDAPPVRDEHAATGGWGLRIVDDVSDAWGLRRDRAGTHVWMERQTNRRQHGPGPESP